MGKSTAELYPSYRASQSTKSPPAARFQTGHVGVQLLEQLPRMVAGTETQALQGELERQGAGSSPVPAPITESVIVVFPQSEETKPLQHAPAFRNKSGTNPLTIRADNPRRPPPRSPSASAGRAEERPRSKPIWRPVGAVWPHQSGNGFDLTQHPLHGDFDRLTVPWFQCGQVSALINQDSDAPGHPRPA